MGRNIRPADPSRFPGGIPEGAEGADLGFYRHADRYLEEMFRAYPTQATMAGFHRHDALLEDFTPAGVRRKVDLARKHQAALQAVDGAKLSVSARIDRDLVLRDLEASIFNLTELRPHERDPQFHVDILGSTFHFLTLLPDDSPLWSDRLEAMRGRMQALPVFLRSTQESLQRPARVSTDMVLGTHAGVIRFFAEEAPRVFAQVPALEASLLRENERTLATLRDHQRWLESDLLPRATGDWRLGTRLWTEKLRHALSSDLTPDEITRRAQAHIDRIRGRMLDLARPLHDRLFPDHVHPESGDPLIDRIVGEVLEVITRRHPSRDTLFESVRQFAERIKEFLRTRDLIELPPDDDNFVIEPTPGFLDGIAVAFFNPPPILEPGLKKSYWISSVPRGATPDQDAAAEASFFREYNDYNLQGLTVHEAFPGHYVQYWHALRSPLATIYKKIFSSGTFAEGWAVLCEDLVYDAGYADGEPENMLIHLKQALRSPINALLDARLHTSPMSDVEADRFALELMQGRGFQEEAEARAKLRRAKVTSTQLSTYFVGYVEMSEILEEARRREGDHFRLKPFAGRLLSYGTIPPGQVRALIGSREENGPP